jgi:adenylate cyclase
MFPKPPRPQLQRLRGSARYVLGLAVLVLFLLNTMSQISIPYLDQLENHLYDWRVNLSAPRGTDTRIIIADIDEYSLNKLGHWPWNRNILAQIVDRLFDDYQVNTVGFDVLFAEADNVMARTLVARTKSQLPASDRTTRRNLELLEQQLDTDVAFAESLRNRKVALGYVFRTTVREGEPHTIGKLPPPPRIQDSDLLNIENMHLPEPEGYSSNIETLSKNASSAGYFDNPLVSEDGIFRRIPMLQLYDGKVYESLSLAVVRTALDIKTIRLISEDYGTDNPRVLEGLELGDLVIPTDKHTGTFVPFRGKSFSFPYISLADVYDGETKAVIRFRDKDNIVIEKTASLKDLLKDSIVLVGTSAPGLLDLRNVPVEKEAYPGVEVHANMISGILDQTIRHKPTLTLGYEFAVLLASGLFLVMVLPRLNPINSSLVSMLVAILLAASTWYAWDNGYILPMASPLVLTFVLFIMHITLGYFVESRGKRELARLFGQYIPPELVDEMSNEPENYSVEPDSRELTVLFSDVRSFTTISEGLPPKELAELINGFLTPMTRIIHEHRGTIDKYMGDAIMAFWGAPLDDDEHARRALESGMSMLKDLDELNQKFKQHGWPTIEIGIGINTGEMNVGNMGSEFRMAYTVMGDEVNLGSRLEGLTKAYGVSIIVSDTTRIAVPDHSYRELDLVRVKGKSKPVRIFEPVGETSELSNQVLSALQEYHDALSSYRSQKWDSAEMAFFRLGQSDPECRLYQVYLDRIAYFRSKPPGDDWDGIFTHTSK